MPIRQQSKNRAARRLSKGRGTEVYCHAPFCTWRKIPRFSHLAFFLYPLRSQGLRSLFFQPARFRILTRCEPFTSFAPLDSYCAPQTILQGDI